MDFELRNEIDELLVLALEGMADDKQICKLNQYIRSNSKVEQYCIDFLALAACLRKTDKITQSFLGREPEVGNNVLREIIEEQWDADQIQEQAKITEQRRRDAVHEALGTGNKTPRASRSKLSLASVLRVCGAVAAIVMLAFFLNWIEKIATQRFDGVRSQVASLTSGIGPVWEYETESMLNVDRLRQGKWKLIKGIAEITFDDGAVVTLEAPAEFRLKNEGAMLLDSGRIFAYVPLEAVGFSVDTPVNRVVDLGTSFGIEVEQDGSSELHMFKGKASLITDNGKGGKNGVELEAGRAVRVNKADGQVTDVVIKRNVFVQKFDASSGSIWRGENLDLADIVGGGNGFGSGQPGISIDSMTGEIGQYMDFTKPKDPSVPSHFSRQLYNTKFTLVKSLPFIDSIVFPYGNTKQGVKISSHNHFYKDGPYSIGVLHQHISNYNPGPLSDGKMQLNGKKYGLENLPMIYIHATSGITFDMEAMRKAVPGVEITRFKCMMGLDEKQENVIAEDRVVKYNFVVLIDGNKVVDESRIRPGPNLVSVDIPINNGQRFLTIFVNDGGDKTANDRCVIAEPILELRPEYDNKQ